MESLRSPGLNFLHHTEFEQKPASVLMRTNASRTEHSLQFNFQDLALLWEDVVGQRLAIPFNIMHVSSALMWYLASDVWLHGFLKGVRLTLSPEYVRLLQQSTPDEIPLETTSFTTDSTVSFVGERSYGISMSACTTGSRTPVSEYENLMYPLDPETMKVVKSLPGDWREKYVDHIHMISGRNWRLHFPPLPLDCCKIHSSQLRIHKEHLDENDHTNYKIYLMGSIATFYESQGRYSPILREIVICYERESKLGDEIRFDLMDTSGDSGSMYVACYLGGRRLCYSVFRLAGHDTTDNSKL